MIPNCAVYFETPRYIGHKRKQLKMHTASQPHTITLLATVHIATTMILTNEPMVTMSANGDTRTVTFAFAAGQQVTAMVKAGQLRHLMVTLRAGCQPSLRALEDAREAQFEVPMFAEFGLTSYVAVPSSKHLLGDKPVLLSAWQLVGDRSEFLADMLTSLVDVDLAQALPAATTNHIGVVSALIAAYRQANAEALGATA